MQERDWERFPAVVEIMMENASCNMRCEYCFGCFRNNKYNHTNEIPPFNKEILDDRFKKVDPDYKGEVKIWGGEPLLHWDIYKQCIEYAKNRFPKALLRTVTNGTLLTPDKVEFIINNKIHISISHDGYGQHTRGIDPFDNDQFVSLIKRLYENNLVDSYHTVINKSSQNLEKQIEYWENISSKLGYTIGLGASTVNVYDKKLDYLNCDLDEVYKWLDEILLYLADPQYKISKNVQLFGMTAINSKLFRYVLNEENYTCLASKACSFGLSGRQYHCVEDLETRSTTNKPLILYNHKVNTPDFCKQCEVFNICTGWCELMDPQAKINACKVLKPMFIYLLNKIHNTPGLFYKIFTNIYQVKKYDLLDIDNVKLEFI